MEKVKIYACLADIHYPLVHRPTLNAILDFLSKVKVDGIIFQGDQLDMQNISHHTRGKPGLRSRSGYLRDVKGFERDILNPVEALLKKDCERYWIIGNHEDWEQDLINEQPELEELIDHKRILDLDRRGYEVIPLGHCIRLGKLTIIHGEILSGIGNQAGGYPARKAVQLYAGNVLAAHTHSPQVYTQVSPVDCDQKWQAYISPIVGACNPGYLRNRPTGWLNGFSLVELHSDGTFNLYLITIIKGKFSFGGIMYGGKQ
jgi:hypothetical protein